MFSFNQMGDLFFQSSSIPYQQQTIPQDLIQGHVIDNADVDLITNKSGKSKRKKVSTSKTKNGESSNEMKKLMHRELEKHRRQEMAALYGTLRSLLPYEYIKGKRATSDHINEAANYIKHKQKMIKELTAKRDELKKFISSTARLPVTEQTSNNPQNFPVIQPCVGGFEVIFSTAYRGEQVFSLTEVLELLIEEGLDIVSCVSTKVQDGLLHKIHIQVNDSIEVDLPGLQQKLSEATSSW